MLRRLPALNTLGWETLDHVWEMEYMKKFDFICAVHVIEVFLIRLKGPIECKCMLTCVDL